MTQSVTSSNILTVGYEPTTRALEIEFKNGGVYRYDAVPEATYQDLVHSPSPGRHFAQYIKPVFACRRLEATS